MYIKYRPTKHFSIIWVLYFYCLPQAIVYLLYFDVLIASNHEFVQSTKEIQVASFYIYCLSFVAVFYRSKSIEHGKGMFFRVWLRKPLIDSLQFCSLKGKQTGSQTPKVYSWGYVQKHKAWNRLNAVAGLSLYSLLLPWLFFIEYKLITKTADSLWCTFKLWNRGQWYTLLIKKSQELEFSKLIYDLIQM